MKIRQWWEILEVPRTASRKEIKNAYALLVKQYHPEDNLEEYINIRNAYEQALLIVEYENKSTIEAEKTKPIINLGLDGDQKTKDKIKSLDVELTRHVQISAKEEIEKVYYLYENHKNNVEKWMDYINSKGFKENNQSELFLHHFRLFLFIHKGIPEEVVDAIANYFYRVKNESVVSTNAYKEMIDIIYFGSLRLFEYDNYNIFSNYRNEFESAIANSLINSYAEIYKGKRHSLNVWKTFFESEEWIKCKETELLLITLTYFLLAKNCNFTKRVAQYQITMIKRKFEKIDENNQFLGLIIGILTASDCDVVAYEKDFEILQNQISRLIIRNSGNKDLWQALTKLPSFFELNHDIRFIQFLFEMLKSNPRQKIEGYKFIFKNFNINQFSSTYDQLDIIEYRIPFYDIAELREKQNWSTLTAYQKLLMTLFVVFIFVIAIIIVTVIIIVSVEMLS